MFPLRFEGEAAVQCVVEQCTAAEPDAARKHRPEAEVDESDEYGVLQRRGESAYNAEANDLMWQFHALALRIDRGNGPAVPSTPGPRS
jgi:hypothetical protein